MANRDRTSPYKMISVAEAHAIILSVCIQDSEVEILNIIDVLGRVLAEDVRSFDALPPFPSSIKDGYAVKASDGPGKRIVVDGVAAGDSVSQYLLTNSYYISVKCTYISIIINCLLFDMRQSCSGNNKAVKCHIVISIYL